MGVADGRIPDDMITYSNTDDTTTGAGRISGAPWKPSGENDYIEFGLIFARQITVITTQGTVSQFTVQYLTDSEDQEWRYITEDDSNNQRVCQLECVYRESQLGNGSVQFYVVIFNSVSVIVS